MNNEKSLTKSVLWKMFERASVQIISLIVQIILARMIAPKDFGSLSIIIVFYNIADLLVQKGFGSSLIRKKNLSQEDIDTSFLVSSIFAIVTYGAIFILAPEVGILYHDSSIIMPLRVLAINILISPLFCIYNAILIRNMKFKIIFFRGLCSSTISGIISIVLAYMGFGIWALVFQMVANQVILTITMILFDRIKISNKFSKKAFKEVFNFGKDVLITELLLTTIESVRTLLVGKKYTSSDLAYYDRGQMYPATLMRAINDTLFSTLLPHLSMLQDDFDKLKKEFTEILYRVLIIVVPIFMGLAAISNEVIIILLTERWKNTVIYMQIFCIYQVIFPYQIISKTILYAIGDSKKVLRIELIKSSVSIVLMIIALFMGPIYVAASLIVVRTVSDYLYVKCVKKRLGGISVIKNSWKPFAAAIIMLIVIAFLNSINLNIYILLLVKILVGGFAYILSLCLLDKKIIIDIKHKLYRK